MERSESYEHIEKTLKFLQHFPLRKQIKDKMKLIIATVMKTLVTSYLITSVLDLMSIYDDPGPRKCEVITQERNLKEVSVNLTAKSCKCTWHYQ